MFPFLLNITYQAMCNVIPTKNVRIQLPLNDKSIFCDWIKTVPAAQVPDILGSKMGYRAIKTSESETNFYRRCLNSEPKPAAAPGSPHMEFCPPGFPVSGGRRGTAFEVEAVFPTCGYHLRLSGLVFVTRCWHYLTISWHLSTGSPLNWLPPTNSETKTREFEMECNTIWLIWWRPVLFYRCCLTMSGIYSRKKSSRAFKQMPFWLPPSFSQ